MGDEKTTVVEKSETTQIMIRMTPDVKKRIKDQIDQGKFTTYSDFARSAIYEKLNREEYMGKFHDMLLDDFDNPKTRAKFRQILAEMLAFDHNVG